MPVIEIIIGNICCLCAMITDSFSGTRKKNSEIMGFQIFGQLFYGVGNIVLKGYSGAVQNAVAILRNFVAMKNIKNKVLEWTLILLGVVLGVVFNNRGLWGLLPVVANLEYSIAIFKFKDNERNLKISFIINLIMFSVYSGVILSFVGVVSNLVIAGTTLISLIKTSKRFTENPNQSAE